VESLTARECDIARLVPQALGNKSIANRLGMSEGTLKVHLQHIYRKLRLDDAEFPRIALAVWQVRQES
jgi:DNA-binding NarL/FixJ family response regulator